MHRNQSRQMFIYLKKRKVHIPVSASTALFYLTTFYFTIYIIFQNMETLWTVYITLK